MSESKDPLFQKSSIPELDEEEFEEDSEDERIRDEEERQREDRQEKNKVAKTMVVGTGFSFDITQFFSFTKAKDVRADNLVEMMTSEQIFLKNISGGHLAWFILLYSVVNAAMIPPWIMSIKANKFLRICWRFLLQMFMIIPFVLYQRRSGGPSVKAKYTFEHILKSSNLKKVYISSFATSFWFTVILTCFQWTYISHAMILSALSNFFLSITRIYRGQPNHQLQKGGQVLVMIGVMLVMQDAYLLNPEHLPPEAWAVINPFYLNRMWYQRVFADIVAFITSYVMSNFSRYTSDLKEYYPPYLSMLISYLFVSFNMCLSAYFFNGATFDLHSFFGIFAIFTQLHFAGFLYMSIILGLGLFMSFAMITKLFSQPIAPALAMLFDPILSTLILNLVSVQGLPGSLTCIGYVFVMPGLFLILMGQHLLKKSNQQIQQRQITAQQNETEMSKLKNRIVELEMVTIQKK